MGWEPGGSPSWPLHHQSSRKWAAPATPTVSWPRTQLHSRRRELLASSTHSGDQTERRVPRAPRDAETRPFRGIVTSNGRSAFNQQHGVFEGVAMAPTSNPSCGCREMCCRVCAQMGYASLDKCKSWQRADGKLHVPDGTQQKAQLHKSPS